MFFLRGKDLVLKEEEPHLEQIILPPNDLSETRLELPQFKQILLQIIYVLKINLLLINYIQKKQCKERHQIKLC